MHKVIPVLYPWLLYHPYILDALIQRFLLVIKQQVDSLAVYIGSYS